MAENKRLLILGKSGGSGGVQSDWTETDTNSMAYIKNKPELSSVATSGNYDDLLNKPTIPTLTSELTNDSNFLTESNLKTINGESIVGEGNLEIQGGGGRNTWYGNQSQFDALTDSELDENTDYYISGLIPWEDVNHPYIPTKVSDLQNDKEYTPLNQVRSEIDSSIKVYDKRIQYVSEEEYNAMDQAGSLRDGTTYFIEGEYVIPTKTSELINDSNFLSENNIKTINGESLIGEGNLVIGGSSQWGSITGNISDQTDLQSELSKRKQNLDLSTLDQAQLVDFYNNTTSYQQDYNLNWGGLPIVSIGTWNNPDYGTVRLVEYGIYGETEFQTGTNTRVTFKVRLVTSTGESFDWSAAMEFVRVCQTGSYNDLTDKPTIPTKTSELTNDSGYLTEHQPIKTINGESLIGEGNLVINSFSGSYNDLTDKPNLSTVATTGSYNDLTDKPTIPEPQVNSDWNASSGISQILNKPTFSTVATTGSYNDLSDKPTIPSNTVPMQVEFADGTTTTYNVYIQ